MGFMPGSFVGQRHTLGYAGGLGAVSSAQMSAAIAQGLDPGTLSALSSVGATDADITALMLGQTDVPTLMAKYAGLQTTEGTTVTTNPAAGTAQVPVGSTLLYQCTWTAGFGNLTVSTNDAISSLGNMLTAHGLSVSSATVTGSGPVNYGIQVVVAATGMSFALVSDVKSILDALMQQIVGNNLSGSSLSLSTSPGIGGTTVAAASSSSIVSWLEANTGLVAGFVAVLILGPPLLKKL